MGCRFLRFLHRGFLQTGRHLGSRCILRTIWGWRPGDERPGRSAAVLCVEEVTIARTSDVLVVILSENQVLVYAGHSSTHNLEDRSVEYRRCGHKCLPSKIVIVAIQALWRWRTKEDTVLLLIVGFDEN